MRLLAILLFLYIPSVNAMDAKLMVDIIECESSGLHLDKKGKFHCNENEPIGGKSCGIAAFQKETFDEMKVKAGMPKLRWKNSIHQMRLLLWMADHGYMNRWSCYKKIMKHNKAIY